MMSNTITNEEDILVEMYLKEVLKPTLSLEKDVDIYSSVDAYRDVLVQSLRFLYPNNEFTFNLYTCYSSIKYPFFFSIPDTNHNYLIFDVYLADLFETLNYLYFNGDEDGKDTFKLSYQLYRDLAQNAGRNLFAIFCEMSNIACGEHSFKGKEMTSQEINFVDVQVKFILYHEIFHSHFSDLLDNDVVKFNSLIAQNLYDKHHQSIKVFINSNAFRILVELKKEIGINNEILNEICNNVPNGLIEECYCDLLAWARIRGEVETNNNNFGEHLWHITESIYVALLNLFTISFVHLPNVSHDKDRLKYASMSSEHDYVTIYALIRIAHMQHHIVTLNENAIPNIIDYFNLIENKYQSNVVNMTLIAFEFIRQKYINIYSESNFLSELPEDKILRTFYK